MHCKGLTLAAGFALAALGFVGFGCGSNHLAERTSLAEAGLLSVRPGTFGDQFAHTYRYYPDQQVYYSAFQDTYFWQAGGEWTSGTRLPATITLTTDTMVIVELYSACPYQYHEQVVRAHPAGVAGSAGSTAVATVTAE